jgi:hypothetical protein
MYISLSSYLETESHYASQVVLKLLVVLPQPPECWDFRHAPPHPSVTHFTFCNLICLFFSFVACAFKFLPQNSLPGPMLQSAFPMFSSSLRNICQNCVQRKPSDISGYG